MACGRPLEELSVAVVDEDGRALPDGHLGEIKVQGPNVAMGYTVDTGGSTRFESDGLMTGDAALALDGELYVLGRIGDSMKIRGRTVFVEDVEAQVAAAEDWPGARRSSSPARTASATAIAAIVEAERGA